MWRFTRNENRQRIVCGGAGVAGASLFFLLLAMSASAQPIGWPRTLQSNGARIEVFQPQVESWENGKLEARAAVDVIRPGGEPVYGVVWFSGRTTLDEAQREVTVYDVEVAKAQFPSAGALESTYASSATGAVSQWTFTIALDRLLADLANKQGPAAGAEALNATPPRIYIRQNPAVLILIDGQPVLRQVEGTELMRVINTPATIVLDTTTGTYYLRGDGYWMTAGSLAGPWTLAANPPSSLDSLLANEPPATPGAANQPPPEVIVSTEPAELIQFNGQPQFSPINGTQLLYATNTDSDVFLRVPERKYYMLLSGRWFRAQNMNGPWEFVPGSDMPPDFAAIPPDHPKARVLASIPGTQQAKDAIAAAQVPQTATVNRKLATFTATYDGQPQFAPIAGTNLAYAVNSPDYIIQDGNRYYAVSDGVWFVADDPNGPWVVCDSVPPEIYTIPPTAPVYPVRYVYVYESTPDYVYVGYTPGYFGVYVWDGVVVYGTGFYYPCWAGLFYYGCPWTWGFGFQYVYWGGGFYWRPWYRSGWYWHRWGRPPAWPLVWNRRMLYNRSVQGAPRAPRLGNRSVYNRWQSSAVVSHPPLSLRGRPGAGIPVRVTPQRPVPRAPDVYAGRDGNVYMHQSDGWYRREGTSWQRVPVQPAPAPQPNRNIRIYTPPTQAPPLTRPGAPYRPAAPTPTPPRTGPPPRVPSRPAPPHPVAGSARTMQQLNQQRQARSVGASRANQFRRQGSAGGRPPARPSAGGGRPHH
jgi:hypothetical protein